MKVWLVVLFPVIISPLTAAMPEVVWLRDVKDDYDQRNMDGGMPPYLEFTLKRNNDADVTLTLQQNQHLSPAVPIYEVRDVGYGKRRAMMKPTAPLKDVGFYQDFENGGVFIVRCKMLDNAACVRTLNGNFYMGDDNFDILPLENTVKTRSFHKAMDQTGYPHLLRRKVPDMTYKNASQGLKPTRKPKISDTNIKDEVIPPTSGKNGGRDDSFKRSMDRGKSSENDKQKEVLKHLSDQVAAKASDTQEGDLKMLRRLIQKLKEGQVRERRAPKEYGVELLVVIDPSIWERFEKLEKDKANGNTENRIREYFSHIVNGIDLRYESIEDSEMAIYVVLSGFIIYQAPPRSEKTNIRGVTQVDGEFYLYEILDWASKLDGLPSNDHIMVFTDYDLTTDGDSGTAGIPYSSYHGQNSVSGLYRLAFVGGICGNYRVSISEDDGYFTTTAVAAHELGHKPYHARYCFYSVAIEPAKLRLGSNHDGRRTSADCNPEDMFIMNPYVPVFNPGEPYSPNPWKFSPCSIQAFKDKLQELGSGNCMVNQGMIHDPDEWYLHTKHLPGQLYDVEEQCRLLQGDNSKFCGNFEDEGICRVMTCLKPNGACGIYTAARGTTCGSTSENKWCIDGQCVDRTDTDGNPPNPQTASPKTSSTKTTTTMTTTTTTTKTTMGATKRTTPAATTPEPKEPCENSVYSFWGILDFTCEEIRGWYSNDDETFCLVWDDTCCAMCLKDCSDKELYWTDCAQIQSWHRSIQEWFCNAFSQDCCKTCEGLGF